VQVEPEPLNLRPWSNLGLPEIDNYTEILQGIIKGLKALPCLLLCRSLDQEVIVVDVKSNIDFVSLHASCQVRADGDHDSLLYKGGYVSSPRQNIPSIVGVRNHVNHSTFALHILVERPMHKRIGKVTLNVEVSCRVRKGHKVIGELKGRSLPVLIAPARVVDHSK
jgi:hypothetical protein